MISQGSGNVAFKSFDLMLISNTFHVEDRYRSILSRNFRSSLEVRDFSSPDIADRINRQVLESTGGRIANFLPNSKEFSCRIFNLQMNLSRFSRDSSRLFSNLRLCFWFFDNIYIKAKNFPWPSRIHIIFPCNGILIRTNSCIKLIFDSLFTVLKDAIDATAAMALLNAVDFEGQWHQRFRPSLTKRMPFHVHTSIKRGATVPMMRTRAVFRIANLYRLDARVLELPYKVSKVWIFCIDIVVAELSFDNRRSCWYNSSTSTSTLIASRVFL